MSKAIYSCHACGASVSVYGCNRATADRLAAWHTAQEHLCSDCQHEQHKQAAAEAAKANRAEGLPELTGSEKQQVWAEQLRAEMVLALEAEVAKADPAAPQYGALLLAHERILGYARASWWIDNRSLSARGLLAETLRKLEGQQPTRANPIEIAAREEACVYPAQPVLTQPVEIRLDGNTLTAQYPSLSPDCLRDAIKSLGLFWSGLCWHKPLGEQDETPSDRVAELGHHLLAAGIPILIWDEALRARAVAGDYLPFHPRWVTVSGKRFNIRWGREDDLYEQAKRLPGSKYQAPCITVPLAEWQEVVGFAESHDLRLAPLSSAGHRSHAGSPIEGADC